MAAHPFASRFHFQTTPMHRFTLTIAIGFSALTGCGSGLPQTVPVSGRVTFDGQPPPGPGTIYFLPQEAAAGFPSRPATGDFDSTGAYRAKTLSLAMG
jgi:hypothetical protein